MNFCLRDKKDKSGRTHAKGRAWIFWSALFLAGLLLNVAARIFDGFAEWYAVHIYPLLVGTIGRLCSLLPFSVIELLLYGAVLLLAAGFLAVLSRRLRVRRALGIAGRIFVVVFFLYTINCGVNYHRTPFSQRAGFVARESTEEELIALCELLVQEINEAAGEISVDASGHCMTDGELAGAAKRAMETASLKYPELSGYYPDAKPVLSTWYLSWQLLQGVYSPFTVEANYNQGMPDQDKPSTICHELSHLKGFMREDEANFVAYLACRGSECPEFRYSGSMLAYIYSGNALYSRNPEALHRIREKLCDQAVRDLQDHNAYWDAYRGKISEVSDKVNDAYLKVNSQKEGTGSYGRMVDLLLEWNRSREEDPAEGGLAYGTDGFGID